MPTPPPFDLHGDAPAPGSKPAAPPTPQSLPPALHQIVDRQYGNGMVALVFRHPAEWQAESVLQWNLQNHSHPLEIFAQTVNPRTGSKIEFFPTQAFYWLEPNWGFAKQGQETGGSVFMSPLSAADTMTRWVLPRYRGPKQGVMGLRVVQVTPLDPRRLQLEGSGTPKGAQQEAVAIRVEYQIQGHAIEEEFCALKTAYESIPTYGAAGVIVQKNWGIDRLFSFCAPKGQLDSLRETAWSALRSVKVNPQWEKLCEQIVQYIQQQFNQQLQAGYQSIADATRLSHQISANSDAWLRGQQEKRDADYRADYQHRHSADAQTQGGTYTTSDAFGDTMMGRDTYDDPYYGANGSQHGYHDEVWTDGQGNYEYRDNGGTDPNVGSDRTWMQMHKREVNG